MHPSKKYIIGSDPNDISHVGPTINRWNHINPAPVGYRCKRNGSFDNRINRHTGKPHEHKRQIARLDRQDYAYYHR